MHHISISIFRRVPNLHVISLWGLKRCWSHFPSTQASSRPDMSCTCLVPMLNWTSQSKQTHANRLLRSAVYQYMSDVQNLLCGLCTLKFGDCMIVFQVWLTYMPHVENIGKAEGCSLVHYWLPEDHLLVWLSQKLPHFDTLAEIAPLTAMSKFMSTV